MAARTSWVLRLPLLALVAGALLLASELARPRPQWTVAAPVQRRAARPVAATPAPTVERRSSTPASAPPPAPLAARLARLDAETRHLLDRKVELLRALDRCLGGSVAAGELSLFLHFEVAGSDAVGSGFSFQNSTLPAEDDARIDRCLHQVHDGAHLTMEPGDDPQFHWATRLTFPIEEDYVFRFLRGEVG